MAEPITRREAISRAVLARLRAALVPIPVQRNRRETVHAEEAPLVNFFEGGHTADLPDTGDTSYEMELPIEATVTADTGDDVGTEMNALYGRVLKTLTHDPTLGGLCVQMTERTYDPRVISIDESERPLGIFSLSLMVEFRTQDGEPLPFVDPDVLPAPLPGDTGTAGPAVGSKYRHVQATPSATWIIRHNLVHYPNYVVVDTAGNRIHPGGESYPDSNTLILGFGVPFSGTADLD